VNCKNENTLSNNGLEPDPASQVPYADSDEWVDVKTEGTKTKASISIDHKSFIINEQPVACPLKTCYLKIDNCGVPYTAG
jgi:hypothetical protein